MEHTTEITTTDLVNLTPHTITLRCEKGDITIRSTGVARCAERRTKMGIVDVEPYYMQCEGFPIYVIQYADITGLPAREDYPGCMYIVSALVAQAANRPDVVSPDSGSTAVRNEAGQIVAVRGLIRWDR